MALETRLDGARRANRQVALVHTVKAKQRRVKHAKALKADHDAIVRGSSRQIENILQNPVQHPPGADPDIVAMIDESFVAPWQKRKRNHEIHSNIQKNIIRVAEATIVDAVKDLILLYN